jgi:hypothetical protein
MLASIGDSFVEDQSNQHGSFPAKRHGRVYRRFDFQNACERALKLMRDCQQIGRSFDRYACRFVSWSDALELAHLDTSVD